MKKILIIAVIALGFSTAAAAQSKAVGARVTDGLEVSYQHYISGTNFVEANLGFVDFLNLNINAAASYNFSIAQFANGFNFYAGPSAGVALGLKSKYFGVGVGGNVGIEYEFNIPLQISFDIRPQIGLWFHDAGVSSDYWGLPTLGIRYKF